ncbi:NAD(P)-dependent oxidoreductase [Agrococcus sp. SGAir0287]|uniref:NAD(P)-dependent oxidoreductase n=1 Tax=Agrococcus sp. SGAir0287 TaxID=2070347 RepID=UPI001586F893|nr:NAD(P)-dependent oxidoreductase [Agrococcus sp. SGAir0287]
MSQRDAVVGVIGLGAMGRPMAEHLLRVRGRLRITGRSRRHADLEERGATWADTPRELADGADVVLSMLPDLPQLEAALDGPDGMLAAGRPLLLLVASTSSSVGVRALAQRLDRESDGRIRVVDCPVSGGVDGATAGTLSIMLGGADADVAEAAEVLEPCGTPVHLGPLGAGEVAKAANQLVVGATMLAIAEATVLAERSGIDVDRMWTLLAGGYAGSNLLRSNHRRLVEEDYAPGGLARYMVKDLGFATDVAEATGTHAALLPALRAAYAELVERGLGDDDLSVARRFVAER